MNDYVEDLEYPVIQEQELPQTAEVCHTDKLPDELWVKIFTHLRLWDRVRTATVCPRWRRASLGSPRWLWSVIPTSRGLEACAFFLERAQRVPVTFRAQPRLDNLEAFSGVIKEHLPHMRVLDLTIPRGSPDEQRLRAADQMDRCLEAALQGPAPMLEIFRVVNSNPRLHLNLGLASLNNDMLRTIKLSGVGLSCASAANVRSLVIATPGSGHGLAQDYWSLLCSFPALESLSLNMAHPTTLPLAGSLFPATLKRLSLELTTESFRRLVDLERITRLDFLRVSFDGDPSYTADLSSVLPLFQDTVPASGAVLFDGSIIDMMVADAAGRQRVVQGVKWDALWCVPFARATRLSICGLAHLPHVATDMLSSLPALEELTLDVSIGHGGSARLWYGGPQLECPSLRAVHVRSTRSSLSIEFGVLSDILQLASGKLPTLVLDRVHVWGRPGDDIGTSLHDLADTVSILDSGHVWPECYSAWATSWDEMMR